MTFRGMEKKDKGDEDTGDVSRYTGPHQETGAIPLPELGLTPRASYKLIVRSFLAVGRLVI